MVEAPGIETHFGHSGFTLWVADLASNRSNPKAFLLPSQSTSFRPVPLIAAESRQHGGTVRQFLRTRVSAPEAMRRLPQATPTGAQVHCLYLPLQIGLGPASVRDAGITCPLLGMHRA